MSNRDDYDIISMSEKDIYSNSREDISSSSSSPSPKRSGRRKRKKKKHIFLKTVTVILCILIVMCGGFYAYGYKIIDKIERSPLDSSALGISSENYSSVKNIALLGIDSREDNDVGRSDAIVILTVDKKHKKLKLTSIARDTYVEIEGKGKDKLTHAYAYGKSQLAVNTLNKNFGLEITDYVTVNFYELSNIIDYIGGVTVDVDEKEMTEMNNNIIPSVAEMGIPCEPMTAPGVQLLSGGQALCYSRIRHTDSDVMRGNRQKEVLTAMFAQVKHMNPLKLPKLAGMIVGECMTSMKTNDIMMMGAWAMLASPEFEQISIPNDNFSSGGKTIGGVWYYVYDLNAAKQDIHDFIFEENYYSAESVAAREAEAAAQEKTE